MEFRLNINGKDHTVDTNPDKPLLYVLREDLQILGPKYSCGIGTCGTCIVLVDDEKVKSCILPVKSVEGKVIITIEGLNDELGNILKSSWYENAVSQCGYCQPGQIIAAYDLLKRNPDPSEEEIAENMTNLCRCGTYQRITVAIRKAASQMNS